MRLVEGDAARRAQVGDATALVDRLRAIGIFSPDVSATTFTAEDFRLYVHDVRLVTATGVEVPVALDDESEPEPDLAVVPGRPADYRESHPARPVLIVEAASTV